MQRKIKRGAHRRNGIISNISPNAWCQIPVKKTYSKITPLIRNALKDWIFNHDHVKQSAFARDRMKVCIDNSNEKVVVPKYFLQIPICELHSDLIKPAQDGGLAEARDDNGRVIISDFNLCKLIPPNVKPMSKQRRILCGCEICVSADILQHSINAWRTKHLKRLEDFINIRRRSHSDVKTIERYNKYKNDAFPQGFPLHRKTS